MNMNSERHTGTSTTGTGIHEQRRSIIQEKNATCLLAVGAENIALSQFGQHTSPYCQDSMRQCCMNKKICGPEERRALDRGMFGPGGPNTKAQIEPGIHNIHERAGTEQSNKHMDTLHCHALWNGREQITTDLWQVCRKMRNAELPEREGPQSSVHAKH